MSLETVQHRSTKYILQNYSANYKQRLMSLKLLSLMYWYELQDMLFIIKCIKTPSDNVDIHKYIFLLQILQDLHPLQIKANYLPYFSL